MKIIEYLKDKGIKRSIQVLWIYKIELILEKIMLTLYKNKPLKDIIIIESHNDFDCNGGAFYDYLIKNKYNEKYKIVWLVRKKYKKKSLPKNTTTIPLYGPSLRKAYYMCNYKCMTFDCEGGRKLKPSQKLAYCSHGAGGLKAIKGKTKLGNEVDYILTQSKTYAPIQAQQWSISPDDKRLVYIGYPTHDILLNNVNPNEIEKITKQKYNKIILWMPTFRKGIAYNRNDSAKEQALGVPLLKNLAEYESLNATFKAQNTLLIIKLHPKQDLSNLKITDKSNIKVLTAKSVKELKIDNYRLMKSVDALISDYSGAAYEFLQLNRPIAYVLDDIEDYKLGFVVDDIHKLIAGHEIYDLNDLYTFVSEVNQGHDQFHEKRQEIRKFIYGFNDAKSCERLAKILEL